MADPVSAGIMVGGSLVGGMLGKGGAKKAARAQAEAQREATAEQRRQFDLTRNDLAPWRAEGQNALGRLGRASTGSMQDFYAAPDYQFVRDEGQRNMGNSFAARGGAFSGNALRALTQFNQNLAAGQYNDWWNRQAGIAGVGQNAVNTGAQLGQSTANNIAQIAMAGGDARASSIMAGRNALASGLNNAISGYYAFRNPTSSGGYVPAGGQSVLNPNYDWSPGALFGRP